MEPIGNRIQSVERALSLLEEVASSAEPIGVRELARMTGLKVPTAQKLLKTLQFRGYLECDVKSRRYRVGPKAMHLAGGLHIGENLKALCESVMDSLFEKYGETTIALTLVHDEIVVVDWRQSQHALTVNVSTGKIYLHAHQLASGRVLLAYQSESFQRAYADKEPLATQGPKTPNSTEELLDILEKTRQQGFGEAFDVANSGIGAYAFPVFNPEGKILCSIGCSVPLSRFDRTLRRKIFDDLQQETLRLTRSLRGHAA